MLMSRLVHASSSTCEWLLGGGLRAVECVYNEEISLIVEHQKGVILELQGLLQEFPVTRHLRAQQVYDASCTLCYVKGVEQTTIWRQSDRCWILDQCPGGEAVVQ